MRQLLAEALVEIHTEDCEVGNVAVSGTFRGHDGLREFWTSYRSPFSEMRSEFRNVFASEVRLWRGRPKAPPTETPSPTLA